MEVLVLSPASFAASSKHGRYAAKLQAAASVLLSQCGVPCSLGSLKRLQLIQQHRETDAGSSLDSLNACVCFEVVFWPACVSIRVYYDPTQPDMRSHQAESLKSGKLQQNGLQ